MTSSGGEWAAMSPPEGSVDIRLLDLVIEERWIVAMAKDLHDDLQAGTSSPGELLYLAQEIVFVASRLEPPQPGEVGYPRYEATPVPTILRNDRVWIEGFSPDWPDRLWICYPDDAVTSADAEEDGSDVP
jgi:hypothetical protein